MLLSMFGVFAEFLSHATGPYKEKMLCCTYRTKQRFMPRSWAKSYKELVIWLASECNVRGSNLGTT